MGKRDVAVRQGTQNCYAPTNICISAHYIPECEVGGIAVPARALHRAATSLHRTVCPSARTPHTAERRGSRSVRLHTSSQLIDHQRFVGKNFCVLVRMGFTVLWSDAAPRCQARAGWGNAMWPSGRGRKIFASLQISVYQCIIYPNARWGSSGASPTPRSSVAPSDGVPQFAQPPPRRAAWPPVHPATHPIVYP